MVEAFDVLFRKACVFDMATNVIGLSTIIPTHFRPVVLPRAVRSALECQDCDVEVIVVPNGGDLTWRLSLGSLVNDSRIRVLPTDRVGVAAARNHGLAAATRPFVRFLDDDDYFLPSASAQVRVLAESAADVCSGNIRVVTADGHNIGVRRQPTTTDFCAAMLCPGGHAQVGSHVYRRAALAGLAWNEASSLNEDVEWLVDLVAAREMDWIKLDADVVAWVQGSWARLSYGRDPGASTLRRTADVLLRGGARLDGAGRLDDARRQALARGLWGLIQKGLRYDIPYFRQVADAATRYAPTERPPSRLQQSRWIRGISPLTIELALVPLRWAHAPIRYLGNRLTNYRA